jgi:sugar transferase (PEP-CTERM system associated)
VIRRLGNPSAVLAITDATLLMGAFYLALGLRFDFDFELARVTVGEPLPRAISFSVWVLLGLLSMGLYRSRQRPTVSEVLVRVLLGTAIGGICNVLFFYAVPTFTFGRGVMLIALSIAVGFLLAIRIPILQVIDHSPMKRRVLVIGGGELATKLSQLRRKSDRRRFDVVAFVILSENERRSAANLGLGPLVSLDEARRIGRIDEIVVAMDDRRGILPVDFLLSKKQSGVAISDIVDFLERETERIDLEVLRPSWLLYENSSQTKIMYRSFTRLFDVVFSVALLTAVSPLLVLAAIAIVVEDGPGAPIIYRQRRVGRNGRIFNLVKFRSMSVDAEAGGGPQFAATRDSRVTRVGSIMRRFRIDELPQILNIIRGDMSVVGPRPERPEFVSELSQHIPLYFYRHCVRPGLTGWAQINFPYGASLSDAREKLKYDLYYIKNATLVMDFLILLQTLEIVIWGRGTTMSGGSRRADGAESPPAGTTAEERDSGKSTGDLGKI